MEKKQLGKLSEEQVKKAAKPYVRDVRSGKIDLNQAVVDAMADAFIAAGGCDHLLRRETDWEE